MEGLEEAKGLGKWLGSFDWNKYKTVNVSSTAISAHLKKVICSYQMDYTNFQFQASLLHKKFKESEGSEKENNFQVLNDFIDAGIKINCQFLAKGLQEYFCISRSANIKARVGFHAVDTKDMISPLFITNKQTEFEGRDLKNFSAFQTILDTGVPYLSNNIPRDACKKSYCHDGMDVARITSEYKGIKNGILNSKLISRWHRLQENYRDADWDCIAPKATDDNQYVYKSHLIVPVTFMGHANKISKELINVLNLRDDGRSILGFIAIDHPATYYFDGKTSGNDGNIDVNVAVIFADMLSLIRILEFMYTTGSKSYRDHQELSNIEGG